MNPYIFWYDLNPFLPNAPFWSCLKTSKSIWFSHVFSGIHKEKLGINWLNTIILNYSSECNIVKNCWKFNKNAKVVSTISIRIVSSSFSICPFGEVWKRLNLKQRCSESGRLCYKYCNVSSRAIFTYPLVYFKLSIFVSATSWSRDFKARCDHFIVPAKVNLFKWYHGSMIPYRYLVAEQWKYPGIIKLSKAKFHTKTKSNMHNSMVLFTFSFLDHKNCYWANLVHLS